jgi:hypothetical protein
MKIENIQKLAEGFAMQGTLSNEGPNDEAPYLLRPIPIEGRLIGKAIGTLIQYGAFKDDEHAISVIQIRKDLLEALDEDEIRGLIPECDAEKDDVVKIVREIQAALEIQSNSGFVRDGDYIAFLWKTGWSFEGGKWECSHVKQDELDGIRYCVDCGAVIPDE